jgi:5-methylcytosine-specific restriction endonuclease McrA
MENRKVIPEKVRREVITRDQYKCVLCGLPGIPVIRYGKSTVIVPIVGITVNYWENYNGRASMVFEFDHIKPVMLGGSNETNNVRLTCGGCNHRRTALDYLKEIQVKE